MRPRARLEDSEASYPPLDGYKGPHLEVCMNITYYRIVNGFILKGVSFCQSHSHMLTTANSDVDGPSASKLD